MSRQVRNEARRRGEEFLVRLAELVSVDEGTPVFRGTTVAVSSLSAALRSGKTVDDFHSQFPSVSREQAMRFLELAIEGVLRMYEGPRRSTSGR